MDIVMHIKVYDNGRWTRAVSFLLGLRDLNQALDQTLDNLWCMERLIAQFSRKGTLFLNVYANLSVESCIKLLLQI